MSRDALIVGINTYQHLSPLNAPVYDAEAIAHTLSKYGDFRLWRLPERVDPTDGSLHVSSKRGVSLNELKEALVRLFKPSGSHCPDTALFFFSGHGIRNDQGIEEGFLATSDTNPGIGFEGLSLQWLRRLLNESPVRQQLVWLDCCHAGELLNFQASLQEADPGSAEESDRCFIAACREFEVAYEQSLGKHSVLTHALIEGVNPEHRSDRWVTNHTLTQFINETLAAETQCPIVHNSGRAIVLTTAHAQPSPTSAASVDCPYKALAYFEENDAPFFYGRTALTDELIQTVHQDNFVAVIGPSGSGKSSVLRAGLLSQLKLGQKLAGSHAWTYLTPFTPGVHPAIHLAQAIGTSLDHLRQFVTLATAQRVVMVIDQFEELFTLCDSHTERQHFLSSLFSTLAQTSPKLCLIIGIRADFLGHCTEYRELAIHLKHAVTVKPMSSVELKEAIVEPAKRVNVQAEPQLVHRMVEDVMSSPGSLPLLQFSLTALWNTRRPPYDNFLTLAAYDELGDIQGTLERAANQAFERLSVDEQPLAKRIFLELTQLGEGVEDTRRRIHKQDLITHPEMEPLLDEVIGKLVAARLIITDQDSPSHSATSVSTAQPTVIIDVAHEALIRHWQRLRGWLKDYREALPLQRDLQAAAQDWVKHGKPHTSDYLLQGVKLDAAEDFIKRHSTLLPLSLLACDYVHASQIQRRRSRQALFRRLAALTVVLGTTAIVAITGWIAATDESIGKTAELAISDLQRGDPIKALVESLKAGQKLSRAIRTRQNTQIQTLTALLLSIYQGKEINRLEAHDLEISAMAVSADGNYIASGGWDNTIHLWKLDGTRIGSQEHAAEVMGVSISADGKIVASGDNAGTIKIWYVDDSRTETIPNSIGVTDVQFSPEGNVLAIATKDGTIRLWHLSENRWIEMAEGHQRRATQVAFSPDGTWLASASEDSTVVIWNAKTGQRLGRFEHHSAPVTSLSISPDGQTLASGDRSGQIHLWQWDGAAAQLVEHARFKPKNDAVSSLSFSPDGQHLAASYTRDNIVHLFLTDGITDGILIETYRGHEFGVRAVSLHPAGNVLLSAGDDGTIRLWELRRKWHDRAIYGVSISPDGTQYASASGDGTVKLWDRYTHTLRHTLSGHQGTVHAASFSPDGHLLASASADHTLKLWNANDGQLVHTLEGHEGNVYAVGFSPDGQTIASASEDGTVRLWDGQQGTLRHTLHEHTDGVTALSFHPTQPHLSSSSWDGTVKIWDFEEAQLLGSQTLHSSGVTSVAFSPDGTQLAASSGDGVIWMGNTGDHHLKEWRTTQGEIKHLTFHPNGQTLISSGSGKQIQFWSIADRQLIRTLYGHRNQRTVTSVALSTDGTLMVSSSDDQSLIPWMLELNPLMQKGCDRLSHYLKHNPTLEERDRLICADLSASKQAN